MVREVRIGGRRARNALIDERYTQIARIERAGEQARLHSVQIFAYEDFIYRIDGLTCVRVELFLVDNRFAFVLDGWKENKTI